MVESTVGIAKVEQPRSLLPNGDLRANQGTTSRALSATAPRKAADQLLDATLSSIPVPRNRKTRMPINKRLSLEILGFENAEGKVTGLIGLTSKIGQG
jgi:hypothetical protein